MNKKAEKDAKPYSYGARHFAAVFAVTEFVPLAQYVGGETNALYLNSSCSLSRTLLRATMCC